MDQIKPSDFLRAGLAENARQLQAAQTDAMWAVHLCRHKARHTAGLGFPPTLAKPAALDLLSPEEREKTCRVAAESVADWERAGRPKLDAGRIADAQQWTIACLRERGSPLP